jgi:flagellin
MAIAQKLTSQIKGSDQAVENMASSQDLLQTAESALDSITGSLQRVRELGVQAQNATMTDSDRSIIQNEINEIFSGISQTAQNTEFNTMKLLDGSFTDKVLGAGSNGQGSVMQLENSSLQALGIDNFSVEGNFDLSTIDQALETVQSARSNIGSRQNGLTDQINQTQITGENLSSGRSQIADLDISQALIDLNREKVLSQYKMALQNKSAEQEQNRLGLLL